MATSVLCREVVAATAVEHAAVARLIPRVTNTDSTGKFGGYQLNIVLVCSSVLEIYEVRIIRSSCCRPMKCKKQLLSRAY